MSFRPLGSRKARQAAASTGLWRVGFPPRLVRPGRRLPVQGLSEGSLGCRDRLPTCQNFLRQTWKSINFRTNSENRVCFLVLCKRHWINRGPGAHRGDSLYTPLVDLNPPACFFFRGGFKIQFSPFRKFRRPTGPAIFSASQIGPRKWDVGVKWKLLGRLKKMDAMSNAARQRPPGHPGLQHTSFRPPSPRDTMTAGFESYYGP